MLRAGLNTSPRRLLRCLLAGAFFALPFLCFRLWPLAWFALIPAFLSLRGLSPREGATVGLLMGLGFWLSSLYWLAGVTVGGFLVLVLYLSLFWAAWGALTALFSSRPRLAWWAPAAAWVALEYLRAVLFSGFPWNPAGTSQAFVPCLIQVSAWSGVYGVSFLVVLVNGALSRAVARPRRRIDLVRAGLALVLLGISAVGGGWRLEGGKAAAAGGARLKIALVQGGIPQEIKWNPSYAQSIFERYLELTEKALERKPDLVLWPESALPWYLEDSPRARSILENLAVSGQADLVVGGDTLRRSPRAVFNSAFHVSPGGGYRGRYDKLHLVPFGEYVPLGKHLAFLQRVVPWEEDFSPGRDAVLFPLASRELKVGTLICFEDIIPVLSRRLVSSGAGLLLNLTNDAWFGRSPQPYQHAAAAVFRAVENRVSLARATNTGYSCLIDPWGRLIGEVRDRGGRVLYASDFALVRAPLVEPGTFYTRHGDLFAGACIVLVVLALAGLRRQFRK